MSTHNSRRDFIRYSLALGLTVGLPGCFTQKVLKQGIATQAGPLTVNDVQSKLNQTTVSSILYPTDTDAVARIVWSSAKKNQAIATCGGRHSMGGQQFATNAPLLDSSRLSGIIALDRKAHTVTIKAGTQWPALIEQLLHIQQSSDSILSIREKQSGVDNVSIGGSISSNIHGRGLNHPPFVSDIESMRVVIANGDIVNVSRTENSELFSLICGGYGLFGIITEVTLRLVPRQKLERVVEIIPIKELLDKVGDRIKTGFLYGDCQYAVNLERNPEGYPGVFSCYRPVADTTALPSAPKTLSEEQWGALYALLRRDKHKAFERFSEFYQTTNGQIYWSDIHQLAGDFFRGYEKARDKLSGSELLLEVYVRPENFIDFMKSTRKKFLERAADVSYGTIRFIKKDNESFLAWARSDLVCIICNLHVVHTKQGIAKVANDFRVLIDQVVQYGGSYYLTYHRFATPQQLLSAYPQFRDFIALKKKYDPSERFQSDWYNYYKNI